MAPSLAQSSVCSIGSVDSAIVPAIPEEPTALSVSSGILDCGWERKLSEVTADLSGCDVDKNIGTTFGIIARGLLNGVERVIYVNKNTRLHEVEKKMLSVCGGSSGLAFSPRVSVGELLSVKFEDPYDTPFEKMKEGDVCIVEKIRSDNPAYSRIADTQKRQDALLGDDRDPAEVLPWVIDFAASTAAAPPPLFPLSFSTPPPQLLRELPEILLRL
jgi:hypothetical protein